MPDIFGTISNIIISPPAIAAAGLLVGGAVLKFFEKIDSLLVDDTKIELALWLLDIKTTRKIEHLPNVLSAVVQKVLAALPMSLKHVFAALAVYCGFVVLNVDYHLRMPATPANDLLLIGYVPLAIVLIVYAEIVETRLWSRIGARISSSLLWFCAFTADVAISTIAVIAASGMIVSLLPHATPEQITAAVSRRFHVIDWAFWVGLKYPLLLPAVAPLVLLWCYAASALTLKAARRLDVAFTWLNRRFDIEKKPLQCVGVGAAMLVTVLFWSFGFGYALANR